VNVTKKSDKHTVIFFFNASLVEAKHKVLVFWKAEEMLLRVTRCNDTK